MIHRELCKRMMFDHTDKGYEGLKVTKILSCYVTKWDLFFNIVSLAISISVLRCLSPISQKVICRYDIIIKSFHGMNFKSPPQNLTHKNEIHKILRYFNESPNPNKKTRSRGYFFFKAYHSKDFSLPVHHRVTTVLYQIVECFGILVHMN